MSHTIVKICGITRLEDGLCALNSGADWLGFIRFPGSSRFRPLEDFTQLLKKLREQAPGAFEAVAVYVDADPSVILDEHVRAGFDRVQLHGSEPMEAVATTPVPVIKAIKISGSDSAAQAGGYPGVMLLTDAPDSVLHGGTGRTYDQTAIEDLVRSREVIVAGGLSPENVAATIRRLHPYGVDVSSGVESAPGIKDADKIRAFVNAVRTEDGMSE